MESKDEVQQQLCNHVSQKIEFDVKDVLLAHQTDSENVDEGDFSYSLLLLVTRPYINL